jgi:hydrogenase maturation protease
VGVAIVRVIGCGNPEAGDDGAGIAAVEATREELERLDGVEVVARASPLDLLHLLEGADAVIVVDAIRTPGGDRLPGALVRAEAGPDGLPAEIRSSLSSHGFGIAESVGLAAAIGDPPRVVVLGVEVESATAGARMSDPVLAAVPGLASWVVAEARALAGEAERAVAEGPTGPTSPMPSVTALTSGGDP